MKKILFAASAALLAMMLATPTAHAQVSLSVQIGPQPVCPYGYYDYSPYRCAPFGYYGPEWFGGGVFLGAGPWFHGPVGFHGHINRAYDPRFGYHGIYPRRGERADWGRHNGWEHNWHGTEMREERFHDNGHHNGAYKEHGNPHGNPHHEEHGHGNPHDDHHGHPRGR